MPRPSDLEISAMRRKIFHYARKNEYDEKELERSNDLDKQRSSQPRSSNPEIEISRDSMDTEMQMDPLIIQRSINPEI